MEIRAFFDKQTFTMTYVVSEPSTKLAIIIDPVLNYEPKSSRVFRESVQEVVHYLKESNLKPQMLLETHAHADHLSGAQALKEYFPELEICIGSRITRVQEEFKKVFNLSHSFAPDGSQFDKLLIDRETYAVGNLKFKVLPTPGHTPACSSYLFEGDKVFTGDALFMPDYGTGRCDFPAASAERLYESITKELYSLPDDVSVFVGHDYQPNGRELQYESKIGVQKKNNIRLKASTTKEDFVRFRKERDSELLPPALLFQSLHVNIQAGHLPEPESGGSRFFKIPIFPH